MAGETAGVAIAGRSGEKVDPEGIGLSILAGLRSGVETHPAFEPRAWPAYAAIALGAAAALAFVLFGGFRFTDPLLLVPQLWAVMLLVGGVLARRIGHNRLGGGCEATALIYLQGLALASCLPMLTAYSGPLADNSLAAVDRALGFDWIAYANVLKPYPLFLRLAYTSFLWQPPLVIIALFASRLELRAWRFVAASAFALILTIAIYPFAPALGAAMHYGLTAKDLPGLNTPWSFGPAILDMKSGLKSITSDQMVGFISFPSYHAAGAMLFAWGAWPTKARWPILALNLAMMATVPIVGAHYLVDLIAGAAVAAGALIVVRRIL